MYPSKPHYCVCYSKNVGDKNNLVKNDLCLWASPSGITRNQAHSIVLPSPHMILRSHLCILYTFKSSSFHLFPDSHSWSAKMSTFAFPVSVTFWHCFWCILALSLPTKVAPFTMNPQSWVRCPTLFSLYHSDDSRPFLAFSLPLGFFFSFFYQLEYCILLY